MNQLQMAWELVRTQPTVGLEHQWKKFLAIAIQRVQLELNGLLREPIEHRLALYSQNGQEQIVSLITGLNILR